MTARRLSCLLAFLLGLAVGLPMAVRNISLLDEGALVHVAERLLGGEVLYRDVVTALTPGAYYLQAALFALTGPSLLAGRVLMALLLATAGALLCAVVARLSSPGVGLIAAAVLVVQQSYHWNFPSYSAEATVLVLAALALWLAHLDEGRPRSVLPAALLLGLAFLFKQNFGAYAGIALLLSLLATHRWLPAAGGAPRRSLPRRLALYCAGTGGPVAVVLGLFTLAGAGGAFLYHVLYLPFGAATGFYRLPFPPLFGSFADADPVLRAQIGAYSPLSLAHPWFWERGWIDRRSTFELARVVYHLPPTVLLAAALVWGRRLLRRPADAGRAAAEPPGRRAALMRLSVVLFAALMFLGVYPRSDYLHFVIATPLTVGVAALLLGDALRARRWRVPAVSLAALPLALWLAGGLLEVGFNLRHPDREMRPSVTLDRPRAGVILAPPLAREIEAALATIAETVGDERLALLSPYPMYYFLTGRPNPLPYPLILPGAMDEEVVLERLAADPPPWLAFSDTTVDWRTFRQDFPRLWRAVREGWVPTQPLRLLEREAPTLMLRRRRPGEPPVSALPGEPGEPLVTALDLVEALPAARAEVLTARGARYARAAEARVVRSAWLLREAIVTVPSSGAAKLVLSWDLVPPRGAKLAFHVGMAPKISLPRYGDGARWEVWAVDGESGAVERLFARDLDPKNRAADRGWHGALVDLSAFAGRPITLVLAVSGGPRLNRASAEPVNGHDLAGWGDPRLVAPPAAGEVVVEAPVGLPDAAARAIAHFDDLAPFRRARREAPRDPDVALALAELEALAGRTDAALRQLEAALRLGLAPAAALGELAGVLDAEAAARLEPWLEEAVAAAPERPELSVRLGYLRLAQGRPDEARELFQRATAAGGESAPALLGLARAHVALGALDAAEEAAEGVLARLPRHPAALATLGEVESRRGDPAAAAASYRAALEATDGRPPLGLVLRYGRTLEELGRWRQALELYREQRPEFPDEPLLEERIGRARAVVEGGDGG